MPRAQGFKNHSTEDYNAAIDDIAAARGYQDTVNGAPNPETKQVFVAKVIDVLVKKERERAVRVLANNSIRAARQGKDI